MLTGKGEYRDAVAAVTTLLARCDPLNLGVEGRLPPNEYAMEAAEIVRRLARIQSVTSEEVSGIVVDVFREYFGADDAGDRTDYLEIAGEVRRIVG